MFHAPVPFQNRLHPSRSEDARNRSLDRGLLPAIRKYLRLVLCTGKQRSPQNTFLQPGTFRPKLKHLSSRSVDLARCSRSPEDHLQSISRRRRVLSNPIRSRPQWTPQNSTTMLDITYSEDRQTLWTSSWISSKAARWIQPSRCITNNSTWNPLPALSYSWQ